MVIVSKYPESRPSISSYQDAQDGQVEVSPCGEAGHSHAAAQANCSPTFCTAPITLTRDTPRNCPTQLLNQA